MLTNLTVPLAGLVDLALLGHLDRVEALGGVALGVILFDYLYWSFGFLRMSTTGLVAKAFGAQDDMNTKLVVWRSLIIAAIVGIAILVLQGPLMGFGFELLQGEVDVERAGLEYVHARIWGAPAALSVYVFHGYLLGRQRVGAALVLASVLNGANIIFDVWFIGFLGWGPAGAGLATMASEWLAVGTAMLLVRRDWPKQPLDFKRDIWRADAFKSLFALQTNILIRTFCLITSFAVFTNLSAMLGTLILTANAILLKLLGMAAYFIDGFAFALESMAGAYAGARKIQALRRALNLSLAWNVGCVLLFVALFAFLGESIIGALTRHDDVIAEAMRWVPWLCVVLLFSGFAYIYDGFFIGLTQGRTLRNAMLISTVVGFLPLAWWSHFESSPHLLWLSMVSYMAFRTATLGWAARNVFRQPEIAL
ncbi:MAG: MATE family efflux transporter [Acidobacteria bacterium]|nr:MATE family efflux transporter [Acidobacteriota bacterium]